MALLTQEVHVFAGPLADDLRLARPDATDDELRAALGRGGRADLGRRRCRTGSTTVVGDGGHRLTVAQAQQLALARLVLADPPGSRARRGDRGGRQRRGAAAGAGRGRARWRGAPGSSSRTGSRRRRAADGVVVLEDGRVVEQGTHDELVAAGGRYAGLWTAWSSGGEIVG